MAFRANDGDTRTFFDKNQGCAQSNAEDSPWWMVDFVKTIPVHPGLQVQGGRYVNHTITFLQVRVQKIQISPKNSAKFLGNAV